MRLPLPLRPSFLAALLIAAHPGLAAEPVEPAPADAVQMLADVALIDGACGDLAVDFGPAFRRAARMGVRVATVMPTGTNRARFEAATRSRLAQSSHGELCGPLARAYGEQMPGLIKAR